MQNIEEGIPEVKRGVWKFWPTIGLSIAIFVIFALVQTAVSLFFVVVDFRSDPNLDILQYLQDLTTNGFMISIAVILSAIVGTFFIILFIRIRNGPSIIDYLGLKRVNKKALLILLGIVACLLVVSYLIGLFIGNHQDTQYEVNTYKTSRYPVLYWLAVIVFAPIFEECFFRGFLFVGLQQSRILSIGAILLTTIAWSVSHLQYSIYGMASIFILGIVLGITRVKTGSLWITIILHSFWNLIAVVSTAYYISGSFAVL